jgi:hypothetical protein
MSVRPSGAAASLFGLEGELVLLRITVEPKLLEDLLETLSSLAFPVNPQLYHRPAQVEVRFPAYSSRIDQVRDALRHHGFDPGTLDFSGVLTLGHSA